MTFLKITTFIENVKKLPLSNLVSAHNGAIELIDAILDEIELRQFKLICLKLGYGEGIDGMIKPTLKPPYRFNGNAWWPFLFFKIPY